MINPSDFHFAGHDTFHLRYTWLPKAADYLKNNPNGVSFSHYDLVMNELGISGLTLIAIAKGPKRNAGREKFYAEDGVAFSLAPNSPVLYFFQRLRDEAHRFAIEGHRLKRSKAIRRSIIDEIQGIGPKRKRSLLNHFGSATNVAKAGLADLEMVKGINKTVAGRIYNHFNGG